MLSLFNYSENSMLKQITNASTLLFIVVSLLNCIRNRQIVIPRAAGYMFAFYAVCAASMLYSDAQEDTINRVFTMTILLFELLAILEYLRLKQELDFAIKCVAVCTIATAGYILIRAVPNIAEVKRVTDITGDSNQVSAYLAHGLLLIMYLLYEKKLPRIIAWAGIFLILAAVALSGSRTGIVVATVNCILMTILTQSYRRVSLPRKMKTFLFLILILAVLLYVLMTNEVFYRTLGRRLVSFVELMTIGASSINERSMSNRNLAYNLAIQRFAQSPLMGKGLSSFNAFSLTSPLRRYGFCPNNYLELLQGVGLLGTIPYYLCYLSILNFNRKMFHSRRSKYAVVSICLLASILLVHFTVVFYYQKLEFVFIGLLIGMQGNR